MVLAAALVFKGVRIKFKGVKCRVAVLALKVQAQERLGRWLGDYRVCIGVGV